MPTTRSQTNRQSLRFSDPSGPSSSLPALDSSTPGQRRSLHTSQRQEAAERREQGGERNDKQKFLSTGDSRQGSQQQYQTESENEEENEGPGNYNSGNTPDMSSEPIMASMVLATKSKIVYNIGSLEMDSRARALAGLTGQFDVVYCRENLPFYEFQLIERPRIRIHDGGAECTCSEFEHAPDIACRHIFWLVDHVYDSISPHLPSSGLLLSRDGYSPALPPLHILLHDHLETLANNLEWPFIPRNDLTTGRPRSGETIAGGVSRQEQVRDIMSAFNKVILPEDFRKDLVETSSITTPRTPEQCVVQGDFEATIFRLAVHDDNVYSSIRKAMPAGACAAIYFDKVQQKSRNLLMHFDEYRRTGRLPSGRQTLEVDEVAKELQHHVQTIRNNLAVRMPYGTKGAVEALITLLQEVSARNVDAFENNSWGRIQPPGEDEDDRNLYEQLIGGVDEDETDGGSSLFILDVLKEVPVSVLGSYTSNLSDILAKVEINRAPSSFLLKLKSLTHDAQSSQDTNREKRPATMEAGGIQKRTR